MLFIKHLVILIVCIFFAYGASKIAPLSPMLAPFKTLTESQLDQYLFFHIYFLIGFAVMLGSFFITFSLKLNLKSSLVAPTILWLVISISSLFRQGWVIQLEALSLIAFPIGVFTVFGIFSIYQILLFKHEQKNI